MGYLLKQYSSCILKTSIEVHNFIKSVKQNRLTGTPVVEILVRLSIGEVDIVHLFVNISDSRISENIKSL